MRIHQKPQIPAFDLPGLAHSDPTKRPPMTSSTLTALLVIIIWCTLGLAVLYWTNRAPIQYLRGIHTAPPQVQLIAERQPALFALVTAVQTLFFLAVWPLFLVRRLRSLNCSRSSRPRKP